MAIHSSMVEKNVIVALLLSLCIHTIYVYIHVYIYKHIHIYVDIYIYNAIVVVTMSNIIHCPLYLAQRKDAG